MAIPQVLAVDGGGTRCRVACLTGGVRREVETGPANASTDLNGAAEQVLRGLGLLADNLGVTVADLSGVPAHVGLAGVVSSRIAQALGQRLPLARARIADDRPAAVRGALGDGDGAVAHCGTGSFFALQKGGQIRLSGGWGPILGDEASAQWVGRKALLAALDVTDGLYPETGLCREIAARIGGSGEIVSFAAGASPSDFGALAPLVTTAAMAGDARARRIMTLGSDHIADTLKILGWTGAFPVCLTGGMAPHYADYLPPDMRERIVPPKGDPIDGGLSLAGEIAP